MVQSVFGGGEDVAVPDDAVLHGHLKNSECLKNMDGLYLLSIYLSVEKRTELAELITYP